MKKKILIFLVAVFAVFTLGSCKRKDKVDDIFKANLPELKVNKQPINETKLLTIANVTNYNNGNIDLGVITVTYEDGSKSVYSLIVEKLLFPAKEDIRITFLTSRGYTYINVLDDLTNERVIYDVLGNKVLQEGLYLDYDVSGTVDIKYDKKGNIINRYYNEVVYYVYKDHNNEEQESVSYYKVDLDTMERTSRDPGVIDDDEYIGQGGRIDLDLFNLPGYYGIVLDDTYYVYKTKDDKKVSSFNLRDGQIITGFDGKLIIEIEHEVTENDVYTYIDNFGDYIKVRYQSIDILTGKTKELNFDYVIEDITTFLDKNDNVKYGFVEARDVINKKLTNSSYYLLIDSSGKTIKDFGAINVARLVPLHGGYYYDRNSNFLLNNDLAPVIEFTNFLSGVSGEKYIVRGRDYLSSLGMINYDGKIIAPFNNVILDTEFYNGKIYALDRFDDSFFYDKKGIKTKIDGNYDQISLGLLIKINEGSINITNYDLEVLYTINDVVDDGYDVSSINTLFGDLKVVEVTKDDGSRIYLKIDVSRK